MDKKPKLPPKYFTIKSTLAYLKVYSELRRTPMILFCVPLKSSKYISKSTTSSKIDRSGMSANCSARHLLHILMNTSRRSLLRLILKMSLIDLILYSQTVGSLRYWESSQSLERSCSTILLQLQILSSLMQIECSLVRFVNLAIPTSPISLSRILITSCLSLVSRTSKIWQIDYHPSLRSEVIRFRRILAIKSFISKQERSKMWRNVYIRAQWGTASS